MSTITNDGTQKLLFLGTIKIGGEIKCLTGLHIGGSDDSIRIGGIDKFVIKNPNTKEPYIPGSSLKGKQRSLMEKYFGLPANTQFDQIWRYEKDDINDAINDKICRLFGSTSKSKKGMNLPSRVIIRDCKIIGEINKEYFLEKKTENTIDRIGGQAMPRTNERVSAESKFKLDMELNVEVILGENNEILLGNNTVSSYWELLIEDLHNILNSLSLIEYSYLGGNGTRGYGKVKFDPEFKELTKDEIIGKIFLPDTSSSSLEDKFLPEFTNGSEVNNKIFELRKEILKIVKKFEAYFNKQLAVINAN